MSEHATIPTMSFVKRDWLYHVCTCVDIQAATTVELLSTYHILVKLPISSQKSCVYSLNYKETIHSSCSCIVLPAPWYHSHSSTSPPPFLSLFPIFWWRGRLRDWKWWRCKDKTYNQVCYCQSGTCGWLGNMVYYFYIYVRLSEPRRVVKRRAVTFQQVKDLIPATKRPRETPKTEQQTNVSLLI